MCVIKKYAIEPQSGASNYSVSICINCLFVLVFHAILKMQLIPSTLWHNVMAKKTSILH